MKIKLQGKEVRAIRESYNLGVQEFAAVLAVHVGTVHRWESSPEVSIDGVAANVLAGLRQRITIDAARRQQISDEVRNALLVGGALLGLAVLLTFLTKQK